MAALVQILDPNHKCDEILHFFLTCDAVRVEHHGSLSTWMPFKFETWKCFRSKSLSCSEILRSWQLGRIAMNKMPRCHSMKLMIVDGCSILDLKHQLNNCFGKSILLNFNDSMGDGLLCCLVLNYQHFCLESFELQFRNTNGAMFSFRAWHFL